MAKIIIQNYEGEELAEFTVSARAAANLIALLEELEKEPRGEL